LLLEHLPATARRERLEVLVSCVLTDKRAMVELAEGLAPARLTTSGRA